VRAQIRASFVENDEPLMSGLYEGVVAVLRDVIDDLSTRSLFGGGGRRLIVVDDADPFLTNFREGLEDYAERPKSSGLLLLDCKAWAANTRLYRIISKTGLAIDCRVPTTGSNPKYQDPDDRAIKSWLISRAKKAHKIQVTKEIAEVIYDLVGPNFGILDNELAKLALLVDAQTPLSVELVQDVVGGWRVKSLWEMLEFVLHGDAAGALRSFDRILQSGQSPVALFGGLAYGARQLAAATRIFQLAERKRQPISLVEALKGAGIKDWPPGKLRKAEDQLKQINRNRAGQIYRWLLEVDMALKGSHSNDARARTMIEEFILKLSRARGQAALAGHPTRRA
jgi:DNA polymerase-3 subunit delta